MDSSDKHHLKKPKRTNMVFILYVINIAFCDLVQDEAKHIPFVHCMDYRLHHKKFCNAVYYMKLSMDK